MAKSKTPPSLDDIEFCASTNKVIPMLFGIDCSPSMADDAIDSEGVRTPKIEGVRQGLLGGLAYLRRAPELREACRVGVVTFGDGVKFCGFHAVEQLPNTSFVTSGSTPMCEAMNRCVDELFYLYSDLNSQRLTPAMATIMLITDGLPNDGPGHQEVARLLELHVSRRAIVWAVGIDDNDRTRLEGLGFAPDQVVTVAETSWPHIIQLGTMSATAIARGQQPLSNALNGTTP